VFDEKGEDARRRLATLLSDADQKKFRIRRDLKWGAPATEVEDYARREGIDLIVMGTHGRGTIANLVLGSVADKLLRNAPCPVLVVRPPSQIPPDAAVRPPFR
jgi:nucleotide-binding universal stress UspA family protein